jgi:hypothetical protein
MDQPRLNQRHGGHDQILYDPCLEPSTTLLRGILDAARG